MYRIISGKFKGKGISAPKNFDLRPTTDFAKEGLFNILQNRYDLMHCVVLDLFAGIGSITFEFCSRGVKQVTAVEKNFKHCKFIEQIANELQVEDQVQVICSPVEKYIENCQTQFDIVFSDAPFDTSLSQYDKWIAQIRDKNMIKDEGVLVVEHISKLSLESLPGYIETRKYGNVSFSFFN